eukprot:569366-Pleurochrysis_carterae.AAC.1
MALMRCRRERTLPKINIEHGEYRPKRKDEEAPAEDEEAPAKDEEAPAKPYAPPNSFHMTRQHSYKRASTARDGPTLTDQRLITCWECTVLLCALLTVSSCGKQRLER